MNDIPFIVTVKASNIYNNNDKYNLINNIKDKELINYITKPIVFINSFGGAYTARLYYHYYIYVSMLDEL